MNEHDLGIVLTNALGCIPTQLQEAIRYTEGQWTRPSVLMRPNIGRDGSKWSVLYGSNIMEGICGYGDTPEEAMRDFDQNWWKQKLQTTQPAQEKSET